MRFLDISLSLVALILLLPLILVLSIILKFTGEGEIFYLQTRLGKNGRNFKIIKFATMLKESPNLGSGSITSKNDKRILPVGRYLRKSKLNEVPQFINILIGDMALIGPRPHVKRDLHGVPEDQLELIHSVRPGLSGISSIIFRNEETVLQKYDDPRHIYDTKIAPCKAQLECWYVKNRSMKLYITLFICTIHSTLMKDSRLILIFYPKLIYAFDLIDTLSKINAGAKKNN